MKGFIKKINLIILTHIPCLILLVNILFLYSCQGTTSATKAVSLKKLPLIIHNIKKNNHRIPSFYCTFSISSKSKGKHLVADGIAHIDKKKQRMKIILFDTLTNETLLDLVLIKNKISLYLFNLDGGIIIKGDLNKLRLEKYIPRFRIGLKDLIHLISGKSLILEKVKEIKQQEKKDLLIYLLKKQNKLEILSVNKLNKRIEKLVLFENGKKVFRIHYRKYVIYPDFYFPKRSDFYHMKSISKTYIYLSKIIFSPKFSNQIFKLKKYTDAKLFNDSLQ